MSLSIGTDNAPLEGASFQLYDCKQSRPDSAGLMISTSTVRQGLVRLLWDSLQQH